MVCRIERSRRGSKVFVVVLEEVGRRGVCMRGLKQSIEAWQESNITFPSEIAGMEERLLI